MMDQTAVLEKRRDGSPVDFTPRRSASAVFATAMCPSVTAGIVSETDKDIIKLFSAL